MASFLDLPYELYMKIFELSSTQDVVSLLQISREAYSFIADESMWKMFCARYGVTNLASFQPRSTFRKVYTGLLHTYGPLIGLWASDHSSTGSIIQFRYWRNGIIGETWRFPTIKLDHLETQEMKHSPQQPFFHPFVFITLALDVVGNAPFPYICDHQETVRIYWGVPPNVNPRSHEDLVPSMHLLSPTYQSLWEIRRILHHPLPDFPPAFK
ncbi:hypothetical protein QCA50_003670 [Cerrena zonata]|uniref:F-box domain-containing protein n=1 Tax=Cerrena zonata TaxID=2478898 RepID=A0AAW0GQH4_9APHY